MILDAAEDVFSRKGFDGASLADISSAAGLSRATPSYFFGSKEKLHRAVLERVFAARQRETAIAVRPVVEWCEASRREPDRLGPAIAAGVEAYMSFLIARPSFGRLIYWEELNGGTRLEEAERNSTALTDAFTAVREVSRQEKRALFEAADAVLIWVSLAFLPATLPNTFLAGQGLDLTGRAALRRHASLVARQIVALIEP